MLLEARAISKSFGSNLVLRDVTFGADDGEIVSLLGPSGCGKSTLLRVIAGLEQEYTGTVFFAGQPIDMVPVHRRGFGLMFQDFALFPHRSVGQNVAFGPRMQGLDRREIEQRVAEVLELVGLTGYQDRTVFELSGGERQRVALARALAPRPRLLLLDEPLGALDRTLRERLTGELRTIIKRAGITSVYVTHDQVEAFAVADRIVLMNAGEIVQCGQPTAVYRHPATPFAARFLGLNNLIEGTILGPPAAPSTTFAAQTALGTLSFTSNQPLESGAHVLLLIRPEAAEHANTLDYNHVCGSIIQRTFRGGTERIVLHHRSGIDLELDIEVDMLPADESVKVALRPNALAVIGASGA